MKKFQEEMKEKAHLKKIKNAKKTVSISSRISNRNSSHKNQQAQLLLHLYENKSYQSIPAYKLLRMSGLQQYTKGFIERGYGINLGKLGLLTESDKKKLYEDLKILPGHTVKLDKLIATLAKQSYSTHYEESASMKNLSHAQKDSVVSFDHSHHNTDIDHEYEKQLERVLNQYTPAVEDKKKNTFNSKLSQKKTISSIGPNNKYSKTKYIPQSNKALDFRKRGSADQSNKITVKRNTTKEQGSKQSLVKLLKSVNNTSTKMSTDNIMEIDLGINKIKTLYRSFDGAVMSSTIANIDIEELVYAFAGLVETRVICAPQPVTHVSTKNESKNEQNMQQSIEDEVGNILRQSYLHPLYRNDDNIDEEINNDEQECISQGEDPISEIQHEFEEDDKRFEESSFLGAQSYQFGVSEPLQIFNQPVPNELDYFKPTTDSIANFIKNIVLAAKMQREIPIMAAHYLLTFITNSCLPLTSLNYKRLLVTVLLLASKIWDDQSFQTPSFSRTFPEYSTVLLNQMQKQVLKFLNYKLKLEKKDYATIYFKMRKFIKKNVKSYQNKKLNVSKIRQLQVGSKKDYKSNFMTKRTSF